jgi:hypothetical protein
MLVLALNTAPQAPNTADRRCMLLLSLLSLPPELF